VIKICDFGSSGTSKVLLKLKKSKTTFEVLEFLGSQILITWDLKVVEFRKYRDEKIPMFSWHVMNWFKAQN